VRGTVRSEEAHSDAIGQLSQIHQGQKIDGLEFAVDGGRAANARGNFQVGAEESRWPRRRNARTARLAAAAFHWMSPQRGLDEIFFLQRLIERHALIFVLRGEGTAANQVTRAAAFRVAGDSSPQHVQDVGVAVVPMDAGSAEFEDFSAQIIERAEIEEFLAVIAEVALGAIAALHAVGAGEPAGGGIVDHEVVADKIEAVAVEAGPRGAVQSLAKLAIKNLIAQALAFDDVFERLGHPYTEEVRGGEGVTAFVHQHSGFGHTQSVEQGMLRGYFGNVNWMPVRGN
jgi:hypothetical protein